MKKAREPLREQTGRRERRNSVHRDKYICGLAIKSHSSPQTIPKRLYEPHRVSGRLVSNDYYYQLNKISSRKEENGICQY